MDDFGRTTGPGGDQDHVADGVDDRADEWPGSSLDLVSDDEAHEEDPDEYYETFSSKRGGRRAASRSHRGGPRRGGSWIALLVLALVAAVVVGGGFYGFGKLKERLAPPPDFSGPGTGKVVFQVKEGDDAAVIGNALSREGVVRSTDAFVDAARKDDRSTTIQVGYYVLKKQMAAKQALGVLVDPDNLVKTVVTVPEGARVTDVVSTIVAKTDFTRAKVVAALKNPAAMGLPASAKGNPEGYLYPATYTVTPGMTAADLIKQMVAKTVSVEQDLDLAAKAKKVNLTVPQVITVASILQYEANRSEDYPKVARVIYNRLNKGMALQLDSTVSYVSKRKGDVFTTSSERASDSRYNTYRYKGLPPGPIGSPGEETLTAALNPAKGDWLFFVPDYAHGTTHFTASYAEHEKYVKQLQEYCRTHSSC